MNVYLIGYRGSGKSTLGKIVAHKLNMAFLDTDEMIVEIEKRSIPEIFEKSGEAYFREVESKVLEIVAKKDNQIVSTGGGIILREENRERMLKSGFCVYLTADPDILYQRIANDPNRPPLTKLPLKEEVLHVLSLREELYKKSSHVSIDTGIHNINETVEILLKMLMERGFIHNAENIQAI